MTHSRCCACVHGTADFTQIANVKADLECLLHAKLQVSFCTMDSIETRFSFELFRSAFWYIYIFTSLCAGVHGCVHCHRLRRQMSNVRCSLQRFMWALRLNIYKIEWKHSIVKFVIQSLLSVVLQKCKPFRFEICFLEQPENTTPRKHPCNSLDLLMLVICATVSFKRTMQYIHSFNFF